MNRRSEIEKYIQAAIRHYRRRAGMSQAVLADVIGKTRRATLSDIERGRARVSAVDLALIAEALGCSISEFLPEWVSRSRM